MLNSFNLMLTFDYETIKNSIHLLNLKRLKMPINRFNHKFLLCEAREREKEYCHLENRTLSTNLFP